MNALRGLIFDKGRRTLSMGRTMAWLLLGVSFYYWIALQRDIPSTLETALMVVMTYVLGDKGLRAYNAVSARKQGQAVTDCEFDVGAPAETSRSPEPPPEAETEDDVVESMGRS